MYGYYHNSLLGSYTYTEEGETLIDHDDWLLHVQCQI